MCEYLCPPTVCSLYKSKCMYILLSYPIKFIRIAVNSINMYFIKRIFLLIKRMCNYLRNTPANPVWKKTPVRLIALRETSASRHHGALRYMPRGAISLYHYIAISLYHYIAISLYRYITISLYRIERLKGGL